MYKNWHKKEPEFTDWWIFWGVSAQDLWRDVCTFIAHVFNAKFFSVFLQAFSVTAVLALQFAGVALAVMLSPS